MMYCQIFKLRRNPQYQYGLSYSICLAIRQILMKMVMMKSCRFGKLERNPNIKFSLSNSKCLEIKHILLKIFKLVTYPNMAQDKLNV